jgi:hypothetical protein
VVVRGGVRITAVEIIDDAYARVGRRVGAQIRSAMT